MFNKNNNLILNTVLEKIFAKVPKKCNCHACAELHKAVKKESGLSRYRELCKALSVYEQ